MARFYFHLTSMDRHIRDNSGKELATANEAYDHARKLVDKILFHMGSDDAQGWKVVISSDSHSAPIIVPFPESCPFPGRRGGPSN